MFAIFIVTYLILLGFNFIYLVNRFLLYFTFSTTFMTLTEYDVLQSKAVQSDAVVRHKVHIEGATVGGHRGRQLVSVAVFPNEWRRSIRPIAQLRQQTFNC